MICPNCHGNGFLMDGLFLLSGIVFQEHQVKQCGNCRSQGEITSLEYSESKPCDS